MTKFPLTSFSLAKFICSQFGTDWQLFPCQVHHSKTWRGYRFWARHLIWVYAHQGKLDKEWHSKYVSLYFANECKFHLHRSSYFASFITIWTDKAIWRFQKQGSSAIKAQTKNEWKGTRALYRMKHKHNELLQILKDEVSSVNLAATNTTEFLSISIHEQVTLLNEIFQRWICLSYIRANEYTSGEGAGVAWGSKTPLKKPRAITSEPQRASSTARRMWSSTTIKLDISSIADVQDDIFKCWRRTLSKHIQWNPAIRPPLFVRQNAHTFSEENPVNAATPLMRPTATLWNPNVYIPL